MGRFRLCYVCFLAAVLLSSCMGKTAGPSPKREAILNVGQHLVATYESYAYSIELVSADESGCVVKFGGKEMPKFHSTVTMTNVETETALIQVTCEGGQAGTKFVSIKVPKGWFFTQ